ncbi:LisH_domain-containing protein [Hexamita inflata]|uniref:LisH domain-containing protein n=1 Tax=Hexamita inflata TaxID=28002 RepID=A0AA86PLG1_9EUKA|nr:LisH domain-containing protein [Hexamita inflata]
MPIDFDELNYIVYRYLLEQGYEHTAFSYHAEANIARLGINPDLVPMGLLPNIIQKALQMLDIEIHLDSKGYLHQCTQPLTFMKPHSCASMNVINQIISREPLKVTKIETQDRVMHCLDNLPKPILVDPQKSLQQIYNVSTEEDPVQNILKQQLHQQQEKQKKELEEKKQEQIVAFQPDVKQSLLAANYVIDRINLPERPTEEIQPFHKQLQLQQTVPEITEQTILQDKPKHQNLTLFYQVSQAPMSQSVNCTLSSLIQYSCTCKALNCICSAPAPSFSDTRLQFLGSSSGQFFVLQLQNKQLKASRDLMQNSQRQSPIVKILVLKGQSRVIVVQSNAQVSVFKLSYNKKLMVNLIYSGNPLGIFQTQGAILSPNNQLLVLYGCHPTPRILQLKTMRVVYQVFDDPFNQFVAQDGFGYIDLLTNSSADNIIQENLDVRVLDCLFIGDEKLAFIREDGLFQVNELKQDQNQINFEIELRDFLGQSLSQLILFEKTLLILTTQKLIFEMPIEAKLNSPFQHQCEFLIQNATLVQNHGIICVSDQKHLFLFSQIVNGQIQIKMDWQVDIEEGKLFGWNENAVLVGKNQIVKINATQEDTQHENIQGEVICADIEDKCSIYGLKNGSVVITVEVEM